jgi:hypothetical protein
LLSNNGGVLRLPIINVQEAAGHNYGKWLATYTMSRHEKRIAAQCDRIGIEHFLPLYVTGSKKNVCCLLSKRLRWIPI